MTEELLEVYPLEVRQFVARTLRDRRDELATDWRGYLVELTADVAADSRDSLLDQLLGVIEPLAVSIETSDESSLGNHLWQLAETAYRHDVPYALISRSFRGLKRVFMQRLKQYEGIDRAQAGNLVEDEIDESRLRVSGFYHMFAERRLRESELLARFLLNNTQDAIFVVDIDSGAVVQVNASAVRLTGFPAAELYGRPFTTLCPEQRREPVREALARCSAGTTTRLEDLLLQAADDRAVPVSMQFVQVRHELATRLAQVSVRDLSVEAAVRREHEKEAAYLRAFVADTADAVVVLDLEGRIRFWNKGAEQIFGYTADEILNRAMSVLLPPETRDQELRTINAIVDRDGFIRNVESVRVAEDGSRILCNITQTALWDPATGVRLGTSVVLRDVTDKRQLEQELSRQARQLRLVNRILEATSGTLDRAGTYRAIASQMEGLLPCDAMTLSLPEEHQHRVQVLLGEIGDEAEYLFDSGATLYDVTVRSREPLKVDDLPRWAQLGADDQALVTAGFRSVLSTPLVYGHHVIGTLTLLHRGLASYDDDDMSLLHHLSGHFAVILENARRFEEERKRSAQFELINQVGASAIANIGEVRRLLHNTVHAVQEDFGYHDVAMYEVDEAANVFRLRAQAGHRRDQLGLGYEQPLDRGVFGEVYRSGNSYTVTDTSEDPVYFNPSPGTASVHSELCVPLRVGARVMGVLDVESHRVNAFDRLDQAAMEALAGILARCMQVDESLRQTRMLQAMRYNIMEAVPSALLVLDNDLRVRFVNKRYLEFYGQSVEHVMERPCTDVFPPSLVAESRLLERIAVLKENLEPQNMGEIHYRDFAGQEKVADLRLRIITEYETSVVVMLYDATTRLARVYQLQMLREIGEEMQRILDIDRLLRAVLTCVTAGPGFGLNRAALFLFDRENSKLVEKLRVGPESLEEAGAIWGQVSHQTSLRDFLRDYDESSARPERQRLLRTIRLTAEDSQIDTWRSPLLLRADRLPLDAPAAVALWQAAGAPEVVLVPLVSQDQVLGLILADNLYTGERITDEDIKTLQMFANQAGLALANAQAFADLERSLEELRQTQTRLRQAEALAGIGKMAANVAHEIRNPLVSIGGFARRIQKKVNDPAYVMDRIDIVVKEVARLERILKNVADFTAPGKPELAAAQPNTIVNEVLSLQEAIFEERHIAARALLAPDLPSILLDAGQVKQVVLNLVRNAIQAMERDGALTLTTALVDEGQCVQMTVADTGPGIPEDKIEEIFYPFFTNKADGTGLGLAVSQKIIVDHGGTLTCESLPGQGATFIIKLPARPAESGANGTAGQGDSDGTPDPDRRG